MAFARCIILTSSFNMKWESIVVEQKRPEFFHVSPSYWDISEVQSLLCDQDVDDVYTWETVVTSSVYRAETPLFQRKVPIFFKRTLTLLVPVFGSMLYYASMNPMTFTLDESCWPPDRVIRSEADDPGWQIQWDSPLCRTWIWGCKTAKLCNDVGGGSECPAVRWYFFPLVKSFSQRYPGENHLCWVHRVSYCFSDGTGQRSIDRLDHQSHKTHRFPSAGCLTFIVSLV